MRVYDIIHNKREGEANSPEEIRYLIENYSQDQVPDYQMAAWAMAVFFQGLNVEETSILTRAMVNSGDSLDLSSVKGKVVDKHSTGGVGDTTSLVLIPLVSAAGVPVAKMSGRGLGYTGGTIDKLESIPGLKTNLTREKFMDSVNDIGAAVAAQTARLAPADKKLYALRDVTATVESIPLIASSIMSKKIAGGSAGLVLDVKVGQGAFMKQLARAEELAELMVKIGNNADIETSAVLTNMDQPLGKAIGNSLEVIEAIETLKGKGPADLEKLCLTLGSRMLMLHGRASSFQEGKEILKTTLSSGRALEQMTKIIANQSGNPDIVEDYSLFRNSEYKCEVKSEKTGYVTNLDALKIGKLSVELGAGREKKGDQIEPEAGIVLKKKYGDRIERGDSLAELYSNKNEYMRLGPPKLKKAYEIVTTKPRKKELILNHIY
ncbi:MAG: thymidine phosphorylase [Bacillota bacterium]